MTIEEVKKTSILDVAASLGVSLRKIGANLYEREDHDSFKIFTDTNTFKWFSRDIQGDVINFVQLVKDVSLKEAIDYLQHGEFKPVEVSDIKKAPFRYFLAPYEQADITEARQYLKQERLLSDETIDFFLSQGVLAQAIKKTSAYYEPVIVFKYLDNQGKLQGASLQGIRENRNLYERGYLKQTLKNSVGSMGLSISIGQPKRLVFLEAPIDLMSYYELHKDKLSDVRLVAMEGLKEITISRYTLEVIGAISGREEFFVALKHSDFKKTLAAIVQTTTFFKNHPDLITLAVDNDEAGCEFIDKLQAKGLPITVDLPSLPLGQEKMDWNDYLKTRKQEQIFQSREFSLDEVIADAKNSLSTDSQDMGVIYTYSEQATRLCEQLEFNQEKFAFLLAHHTNFEIYNRFAIRPDYEKEMMAMTHLYVECGGEKMAMLETAINKGLIADKEAFLCQYAKDFIKPNLSQRLAL